MQPFFTLYVYIYLRRPLVLIWMPFQRSGSETAKTKKPLMNNLFYIGGKQIWKTYAFLTSDILRGPIEGKPRTDLSDRDPTTNGSLSQEDSSSQFFFLCDWFVQLKPCLHSRSDLASFEYEEAFWDWVLRHQLSLNLSANVVSVSNSSSRLPSLCHPIISNDSKEK